MTNNEKIDKIKSDIEINGSMKVTYSVYGKRNKLLHSYTNTACFISLRDIGNWHKVKLKLKCSEQNLDYIHFWINLIMQIETKITIKDGFLIIPNLGRGKTLFILTAIRFLWEGQNNYDDIVIMTKRIIDLHPTIDPLKAILLANSCTKSCNSWGHSLVCCMVNNLVGTWNYRRYRGYDVYGVTNSSYGQYNLLNQFRKAKTDKYDVLPVLKHFGYS